MKQFLCQELNLICICDIGSRRGPISEMTSMTAYLTPEEGDLRRLAKAAVAKLHHMTDNEYNNLFAVGIDFEQKEDRDG